MLPLLKVNQASVREATYSAAYHYRQDLRKPSEQETMVFQYTYAGQGIFRFQDKEYPVPAGYAMLTSIPEASAYFFPKGCRTPWVYCWINFSGQRDLWAAIRAKYGSVVAIAPQSETILCAEDVIQHYVNGTFRDRYHASELMYKMLMSLSRALDNPEGMQGIAHAMNLFRKPPGRPLLVKEAAAMAGVSREHFCRAYRKAFAETPGETLKQIRLQLAKHTLLSTPISVQEVSTLVGYSSAASFYRAFRQAIGCSPEQFRARGGHCAAQPK